MIRVLISGVSEGIDGVGMYVYNLVTNVDRDEVVFDFLVQGRNGVALEKKLRENYRMDCRIYQVPLFKRNIFASIKYLNRLYHCRQYDCVYVNASLSTDIFYVLPFFLKYGKTGIIVHSHNSSLYGKEKQHCFFRWMPQVCAGIKLTCSDKAAEWMFGTTKGVRIIQNGINTERFRFSEKYRSEIREKYNIDEDTLVIGHVGRLMYQKNQEFLIRIVACMKNNGIQARLLLVGDGEDRSKLENLVRQQKLTENVIFCGQQQETEKYYSAFDVFVMPSHYEGLPIVGIEAQAAGLACLFSEKIDQQVILTDRARRIHLKETTGFWAAAIAEACDETKECRENYAKYVEEKGFDINRVAKEVEKLLMGHFRIKK